MEELVKVQAEYIALLEKSCGDMAGFLHVHGFQTTLEDINKGVELRKKIQHLTTSSSGSDKPTA